MPYSFPVGDIYVPCSWGCHLDRNPPSSEAGTDFASGYGTPVVAPATGTIIDLKQSNSSATGRYVTIAAADGRTLRALHLSAIYVQVGWYVQQGATIAASGASGNGSDWYYGPHLHQTLWQTCAFCAQTIDFENYVGTTPPPEPEPTPPPTPEPQEKTMLLVRNKDTGHAYTVGQRFLHHCSATSEANVAANLYNNGVEWKKNSSKWIDLEQNYFDYLLRANGIPTAVAKDVLGGKTYQDGNILGSSTHNTVWTATDVWSGNEDAGSGALLGQGWDRAGKAASRSQEILDFLHAVFPDGPPPTEPVEEPADDDAPRPA